MRGKDLCRIRSTPFGMGKHHGSATPFFAVNKYSAGMAYQGLMKFRFALLACMAAFPTNASATPHAELCAAFADMVQPAETVPVDGRGLQYEHEWIHRGRVNLGNEPGRFRAILPWSVVMEAPGNRVRKARIEIRDMQLLIQSRRTGQWHKLIASNPLAGGSFSKDFGKNLRKGNLEIEQVDGVSTISTDRDHVAHFWPKNGRRHIDPEDIGSILVRAEARMNPEDYGSGARFVMNVAADYWLDRSAPWDNYRTNGDAGVGRFKNLTEDWRKFYMTTLNPDQLGGCL